MVLNCFSTLMLRKKTSSSRSSNKINFSTLLMHQTQKTKVQIYFIMENCF